MHIRIILGIALLCLTARSPALADASRVTTPRGAMLEVVADFPAGAGPFPTIVLASGQGYHLALPALEQTAQRLVQQGVAVYRFNWAFFTADPKKGQPVADLSTELEDLQTVVKLARAEPRVDATRLSVAGKSLGSVVAWMGLTQDPKLRSGLFLTPICSSVPKGQTAPVDEAQENYPGFAAERRPLLFISGDRDPLCAAPMLYAFVAKTSGNARVAIVSGDHSYGNRTLTGHAYESARSRNVNLVALLSASFIAEKAGD